MILHHYLHCFVTSLVFESNMIVRLLVLAHILGAICFFIIPYYLMLADDMYVCVLTCECNVMFVKLNVVDGWFV